MSLRTLVILAVSIAVGVALSTATSVGDGFFGMLGTATLLHTLVEPTSRDDPVGRPGGSRNRSRRSSGDGTK